MSGYFYAYASQATARQSRPDWIEQDASSGEYYLTGERVLITTHGVWLVEPEGHVDENGDWVETQAGEKSLPYVILSPEEDGPAGKRITPPGRQGFA
jgi:hypothetical protein